MKSPRSSTLLRNLLLAAPALLLCQCASTASRSTAATAPSTTEATKSAAPSNAAPAAVETATQDDLDEYAVVEIADPLEKLNRGTFWLNDKVYFVARPISKGYEKVVPQPVRTSIDNIFVNVRYPVRVVNCALQGKFKRAGQETGKFLINTVAGIGGIFKVSDRIDSLADVPAEDTGKTFATWGFGHGAYLVLPVVGPSSIRDGLGYAGDYALNPLNWCLYWDGDLDWTAIPSGVDNLNALPGRLSTYDKSTKDAIDPYVSMRSSWVQYRNEAVKK